jgi:hypothetical protein
MASRLHGGDAVASLQPEKLVDVFRDPAGLHGGNAVALLQDAERGGGEPDRPVSKVATPWPHYSPAVTQRPYSSRRRLHGGTPWPHYSSPVSLATK